MIYIRDNRADYDERVSLSADRWSWHDLIPCFIESED